MAKVEFVGFVDGVLRTSVGDVFGLKVTENHSKKDGDQWVTVGKTFRKLKPGYVDGQKVQVNFGEFNEGDRVKVTGTESTVSREYQGKKYYDLVVAVHSLERLSSGKTTQQAGWDTLQAFADDGTAPF